MAETETPTIAGCLDRWKKEGADEAVAAVRALVDAVRSSKADTMSRLQAEVKAAAEELKCLDSEPYGALSAACDMFVRYVRRGGAVADDQPAQFPALKRRLVSRATRFGDICRGARGAIATLCQDFLLDGCTVLVHGYSPPVLDALRLAGTSGKRLLVLCTEGRPDGAGLRLAGELAAAGVPATVLLDSAVAYSMAQVDVVLVGADLVTETGGVVGAIGTYQVALVARAMGKPVYVAAESYKFARLYPLGQKNIEQRGGRAVDFGHVPVPAGVDVEAPARDYTQPKYLELLITDLGVLPPAAVGDVLLQLSM
ncbi:translation initiation factor eIF-2B subunit alpha-like [Triticum dicoccoides]|uniref:translation initiation factor eIF-2B subunit alpha-like n=1 Tax=Triticum dicoccoides TaxID=85692 RepID=UPI001891D24F|nr:translation initiation factor eIF-2B subunit alpha-like [Triticum dicoccoides]